MEIVIKIPEDDYKRIVKEGMIVFGSDEDIYMLEQALENGVVLPKKHEALKDAGMIKRFLYSSAKFLRTWNLGKHRIFEAIDNVETVVEAYKEDAKDADSN